MTVRLRLALTILLTGLLTAAGVVATVALAFQRFEQESTFARADAFLGRVVDMYPELLDQHQRNVDDFTRFLRNLLLFEPDSQLYLLAADGTVLASVTLTEAQITAATVAMTPTAALANGAQTLIARLVRTGASAELAIVVDNVAPGFANQSHDYLEGQSADTVVATVSASDVSELTGFVITAGNDDGYFSIDSQGRIRITATGAAAEANDFETGANSFTLTVSATDAAGNTTSGTTVTLHVLNKDEASPVLLAQTRSFAEGQALGEDCLRRVGYDEEEARVIAAHCMDAALCGYEYSGLPKILNVAEHKRLRLPRRKVRITYETPVSARMDGGTLGERVSLTSNPRRRPLCRVIKSSSAPECRAQK